MSFPNDLKIRRTGGLHSNEVEQINTALDYLAGAFSVSTPLPASGNYLTAPISIEDIDATGTPSSSTYLRGDGTWATVSGGIAEVVDDTTPQLGGTLDANGNIIDMGTNTITDAKVGNWDTAYSWGDHSSQGYLTSESDPVFSASAAAGILAGDITNWDTAYGWGDHASAGYPDISGTPANNQIAVWTDADTLEGDSNLGWTGTELQVTGDVSITGDITSNNLTISAWNNAVAWGDHALAGYAVKSGTPANNNIGVWTGSTDIEGASGLNWTGTELQVSGDASLTGDITANNLNIVTWNTAAGWGDHAAAGYAVLADNETVSGNWIFSGGVDHAPGSGQLLRLWDDTTSSFVNLVVDSTGDLALGNYDFNVDQTVGAGQDNYVLTYDNSTGKISLEAASGGISSLVEDTTPQLGGTLDANGFDIDMGANHLICDQRIAEHDGDTNTYIEFDGSDSFGIVAAGATRFQVSFTGGIVANMDINTGSSHLICQQRIAEHSGDTNTYMEFPGNDQWSVTVGGTDMLEVGTSGVDIDGYCLYRADVIDDSGTGTTAIGSSNTGQTRRATHSSGTRTYRLDSATVGTQVQFIRDGAGDVTFSAGTSQTVQSVKGTTPQITAQYGMAYAVCVATNQWRVSGDIEP